MIARGSRAMPRPLSSGRIVATCNFLDRVSASAISLPFQKDGLHIGGPARGSNDGNEKRDGAVRVGVKKEGRSLLGDDGGASSRDVRVCDHYCPHPWRC